MQEEHCLIVHESLHVTVVCSFVSVNPHAVSSSLAMELDVDQFVEEFLVKSRSAPKQVESVLNCFYIYPQISIQWLIYIYGLVTH